jgi:hypothetical protein
VRLNGWLVAVGGCIDISTDSCVLLASVSRAISQEYSGTMSLSATGSSGTGTVGSQAEADTPLVGAAKSPCEISNPSPAVDVPGELPPENIIMITGQALSVYADPSPFPSAEPMVLKPNSANSSIPTERTGVE